MTDFLASRSTETLTPVELFTGGDVQTAPETIVTGKTIAKHVPLGRVTATGQLMESVQTASDGSEKPVAISVHAIDTTGGAAKHPVYIGGKVDAAKLTWDASWSAAEKLSAFDATEIHLVSLEA